MQGRGEELPGVQEAPGSGDESEETLVETTETAPAEEDNPDETVEEPVARALEEVRKGEERPGGEGASGEKPEVKTTPTKKGEVEQPKLPEEIDPELSPPERFNARAKQLFNNLPKGLRRELNRTVKDLEAQTTRATQDLRKSEGDIKDVLEATAPYVNKWAERGLTRASAIAGLAAAQERLTHEDPQVRVDTYIKLGRDLGVDFDRLAEFVKSGSGGTADISGHPEIQALRQTVGTLQSRIEEQDRSKDNAIIAQLTAEGEAVRDEIDPASGDYRFPKLHDAAFLDRVKPLVSALLGTVPGLSYGDALRRAYATLEGQPTTSGQLNQPSLLAATNKQNVRAITAVGSVRGRTAPVKSGDAAFPVEALDSPEASARWALNHLRRGGV